MGGDLNAAPVPVPPNLYAAYKPLGMPHGWRAEQRWVYMNEVSGVLVLTAEEAWERAGWKEIQRAAPVKLGDSAGGSGGYAFDMQVIIGDPPKVHLKAIKVRSGTKIDSIQVQLLVTTNIKVKTDDK